MGLQWRFFLAVAVSFLAMAAPLQADVATQVRILNNVQGFIGFLQTSEKSDPRLVSDTLTRDDVFSSSMSFASSDLGTGELKVNATGFPRQPYSNGFIAQANASVRDVLTIVGPGTTPIPVSFLMNVDGLLSTPSSGVGAGRASSFVLGKLSVGADAEDAQLQRATTYDSFGIATSDDLTGVRDWIGATPVPGTTDRYSLLLQFDAQIVPGEAFDFLSEIAASVSYVPSSGTEPLINTPVVSDFGNTALISIVLPEEYTLSSESGVFLAGPIPEPESWVMMLAGLGMLLAAIKRGKQVSRA